MTIKDVLLELINKYGEEFNWYLLPITDKCFVSELKREIGKKHPLQEKSISAVAKCASNDDVLYMTLDDKRMEKQSAKCRNKSASRF